jgi:hypothetical protein
MQVAVWLGAELLNIFVPQNNIFAKHLSKHTQTQKHAHAQIHLFISYSYSYSYSWVTLHSTADLCHLPPSPNTILPVSSVSFLSFQFLMLHLLISVNSQFYHLVFGRHTHTYTHTHHGLDLSNCLGFSSTAALYFRFIVTTPDTDI